MPVPRKTDKAKITTIDSKVWILVGYGTQDWGWPVAVNRLPIGDVGAIEKRQSNPERSFFL